MTDNKVRLQKYMADSGIASRRKSEELIAAGKVRVNGKPAQIGDKVDPKKDKVTVAGKRLCAPKNIRTLCSTSRAGSLRPCTTKWTVNVLHS